MQKWPKLFFFFNVLLLLVGVNFAHAQSVGATTDPVQYILAPDTPGPNQLVNIEVQGVGTFLGDATIIWQENGKTIESGTGLENFSFTTGGVGTVTQIHLVIDSATMGTITHDFAFYPSVINLVWEADASTPILYAGKSLYSAGSHLKVVAFPIVESGGALVPTSQLSFEWSHNDTPDMTQSGVGENTFSFDGDEIQTSETASVDVYFGGTKVGHGEITIPASSPEILLYDQDPLRGELMDQALPGAIELNGKEITVQAEPYFFAKNSDLTYTWTLNGEETSGPNSANGLLTLRQTGSGAGAALLSVALQNTDQDKLIQSANTNLQIAFGQETGSSLESFFGL